MTLSPASGPRWRADSARDRRRMVVSLQTPVAGIRIPVAVEMAETNLRKRLPGSNTRTDAGLTRNSPDMSEATPCW
jgi:hypothetical protein